MQRAKRAQRVRSGPHGAAVCEVCRGRFRGPRCPRCVDPAWGPRDPTTHLGQTSVTTSATPQSRHTSATPQSRCPPASAAPTPEGTVTPLWMDPADAQSIRCARSDHPNQLTQARACTAAACEPAALWTRPLRVCEGYPAKHTPEGRRLFCSLRSGRSRYWVFGAHCVFGLAAWFGLAALWTRSPMRGLGSLRSGLGRRCVVWARCALDSVVVVCGSLRYGLGRCMC